MRLEVLIEALRTHRSSADDCARNLAALAAELPQAEIALSFRTALAVGALDEAFGRRLTVALESLASAPEAAVGKVLEIRDLEDDLSALAAHHEGLDAELEVARSLSDEIAQSTRELAALNAQAAAAAAAAEGALHRSTEKQALWEEVRDGKDR